MDEESEVVAFITETLGDFVFSIEELISEIENAPPSVASFLEKICQNPKHLTQYLCKHGDRFFVENEKVALFDPDLENARKKAVHYFEEKLNFLGKPSHFMDCRSYISQAEVDVQNFIESFYPGETFKQFLLAHPHKFVLLDDDSVYLIENEAVDYFELCLESNNGGGLHYMKLLDYVAEAPKHVSKFINECYPAENFLQLLENNSDVFRIEDENVYIRDEEL